jgi:hypothetical protein
MWKHAAQATSIAIQNERWSRVIKAAGVKAE